MTANAIKTMYCHQPEKRILTLFPSFLGSLSIKLLVSVLIYDFTL
jgi:hypothetical protein